MRFTVRILLLSSMLFSVSAYAKVLAPWYLGIGYGRGIAHVSSADFFDTTTGGSVPVNKHQNAGKVFIGYLINENLASEVTYFINGSMDVQNQGTIKSHAFEWSGVGMIPLGRDIILGATGGVFYNKYTVSDNITFTQGVTARPHTGFGFGYGAFGEYMFTQSAYLRLGWDQLLDSPHRNSIRPSPGMYSASLVLNISEY